MGTGGAGVLRSLVSWKVHRSVGFSRGGRLVFWRRLGYRGKLGNWRGDFGIRGRVGH